MKNRVAEILLQREAVVLRPNEPFTFASGIKSPIYCDNRVLLSYPKDRSEVVDALVKLTKSFNPKQIAGVATAGIAWGAWVAEKMNLPFAYVRSAAKDHGKKNRIEGRLEPHLSTLIVEDLVSTAGSVISAIEALENEKMKVAGAISIFSYGFLESSAAFEKKSCRFESAVTLNDLLSTAIEMKKISGEEETLVRRWQKDPRNWLMNYPT